MGWIFMDGWVNQVDGSINYNLVFNLRRKMIDKLFQNSKEVFWLAISPRRIPHNQNC